MCPPSNQKNIDMSNVFSDRIESLRAMMRSRGWDAVYLTGSDPHSSEYPAERWKQVRWLTGFTGECGDVVVTLDHAGLWTDTRYFIQANAQLEGTGVELHKTRVPEQVLIPEWLRINFEGDGETIIAVDGLCQRAADIEGLSDDFSVVSVPNLLDALWADRPGIPQTPVFTVESGETRSARIEWLRSEFSSKGCSSILLSGLDEIAWTLNVRASDIEYNPLVISYLLVTEDEVKWFVLKDKVEDPETGATFDILRSAGVQILPYDEVALELGESADGRLFVDSTTINYHLWSVIGCDILMEPSPVRLRKAVKNPFEIAGMRRCHIEDGLAMEKFLFWLEKSLESGRCVTEWEASLKLDEFRNGSAAYRGESFETISAYGSGAALPHYVTPRGESPELLRHGLYLCDSGGQYDYGTTDITRTVPLGECTALEKEDYTLVMKCHIDLAMAVFPAGTCGCQLDVLAREPLWAAKRNFGHGTGHGVGFFLGVHEGPHELRQNFNNVPFAPGMVVTDEPGIYREGKHGVRHENILLVVEAGSNDFGSWLAFEPLTFCHYDTSVIVKDLMTRSEIEWLNGYNASVYNTLSPHLPPDVAEWLKEKTQAI